MRMSTTLLLRKIAAFTDVPDYQRRGLWELLGRDDI